jgi:hypothetical protein
LKKLEIPKEVVKGLKVGERKKEEKKVAKSSRAVGTTVRS